MPRLVVSEGRAVQQLSSLHEPSVRLLDGIPSSAVARRSRGMQSSIFVSAIRKPSGNILPCFITFRIPRARLTGLGAWTWRKAFQPILAIALLLCVGCSRQADVTFFNATDTDVLLYDVTEVSELRNTISEPSVSLIGAISPGKHIIDVLNGSPRYQYWLARAASDSHIVGTGTLDMHFVKDGYKVVIWKPGVKINGYFLHHSPLDTAPS